LVPIIVTSRLTKPSLWMGTRSVKTGAALSLVREGGFS
jgi:hypothetical protein